MILVLLPQEGKGQEEDKSTQGDEKDKGQGHLCLAQGLHPDRSRSRHRDSRYDGKIQNTCF